VEYPLNSPLYYAVWAGPTLLAIYIIHGPKPGYQMLALPAVVLAASIGIWRLARGIVESETKWAAATLGLGWAAAVGCTLLPYGHLLVRHHFWFESFRAMPQVHDDIDRNMAALMRLVDERGKGAILLFERSTFESPNTRVFEYLRRGMPHASVRRLGFEVLEGFDVLDKGVFRQTEVLPEWVKEVLIVMHGYDPSWEFRAKYPLMRRVYDGDFMQVWLAPYR
jgi:hypothetical protein